MVPKENNRMFSLYIHGVVRFAIKWEKEDEMEKWIDVFFYKDSVIGIETCFKKIMFTCNRVGCYFFIYSFIYFIYVILLIIWVYLFIFFLIYPF